MQTDLTNQLDQKTHSKNTLTGHGRWSNGLQKIKRNRPLAFAFVVALSLALGACSQFLGKTEASYMNSIQMGNDYKKNNDYVKALESYSEAVTLAEKKYGADSGQVATALGYQAQIYRAQGEWRLAYMTEKRLIPLMDKFEPNTRETKDLKKDFEFVKSKIIEYSIKTDDNYGAEQMKKNSAANAKKPKKKH
jgi:hypothetical protein